MGDESCTNTLVLGGHVYRLSVVDGEVVIHQLTEKEVAIEEIESQPFFRGKHEVLDDYADTMVEAMRKEKPE